MKLRNFQNKTLNLSNKNLKTLPKNFLQNAPYLQELSLVWNQIQSLPKNFLQNAPQLQKLTFHTNALQSLPQNFLPNAPKIWWLSFACNQLPNLPPGFLNRLPKTLRIIDLRDNPLTEQTKQELSAFKDSHPHITVLFEELVFYKKLSFQISISLLLCIIHILIILGMRNR